MTLPQKQLEELKAFIHMCKTNPDLLHAPSLGFFKEWLLSMGASLPAQSSKPKEAKAEETTTPTEPEPAPVPMDVSSSSSEEEDEEEPQLDTTEVVKDTEEASQEMGDSEMVEVSEENADQANEKRSEAMGLMSEQKYDEAIAKFSEAIKLNPLSAPLFAKRSNCFLKLKRPNATIKDAFRAVELNPDSALGHKMLGMAHKMLGNWCAAYKELALANKIDFMDDTHDAMKAVEGNAKKMMEFETRRQQKSDEKAFKKLKRRHERAKEMSAAAQAKAKAEAEAAFAESGGMGGGMPGAGGMGGGGGMPPGMANLFSDPEVAEALKDPEVMAAFSEIMQNPAAMANYKNNPKISKVMGKLSGMFGGMGGGMPGGMGGGMDQDGGDHSAPDCCPAADHAASAPKPTADDLD